MNEGERERYVGLYCRDAGGSVGARNASMRTRVHDYGAFMRKLNDV